MTLRESILAAIREAGAEGLTHGQIESRTLIPYPSIRKSTQQLRASGHIIGQLISPAVGRETIKFIADEHIEYITLVSPTDQIVAEV